MRNIYYSVFTALSITLCSVTAHAQNVGIGTSQPDVKLDITGQMTVRGGEIFFEDTDNSGIQLQADGSNRYLNFLDGSTALGSLHGKIGVNSSYSSARSDLNSLGGNSLAVEDHGYFGGNLGIGTLSTGGHKLRVNGSGRVDGNFFVDTDGGNRAHYTTRFGGTEEGLKTYANDRNLYTRYIEDGSESSPGTWHFINEHDGGVSHEFMTAQNDGDVLFNAGNVGIGTNPSSQLDVAGKATTGQLQVITGATNNHVLTSDANGNATWQDPDGLINDDQTLSISGSDLSISNGNTVDVSSALSDDWNKSGSDIYNNNSGNVGIGTANPSATLDLDGNMEINGQLNMTGNTITNANVVESENSAVMPHLVLHSSSNNDKWTSQGAYVSIGESGALGSASMHMTYRGDGYGFIGSGSVTNAKPGASYLRFDYNSNNISTPDKLAVGALQVNEPSNNNDVLTSDGSGNATWQDPDGLINDDQTLSISGSDLSISNGNTVNISSAFSDDWNKSGSDIYNNNSGKVGIGTANPGTTLDVNGDLSIQNGQEIRFYDGSGDYLRMDARPTAELHKYTRIGGTSSRWIERWYDGSSYHEAEAISNGFHFKSGGFFNNSVGIGTTSPSHKLDVVGNIRAQDRLYVGTGGGYFYNDNSSRIRTNQDFYTNNNNTFLYGDDTYLGSSSGDQVHLRNNRFDWSSGGGGVINTSGQIGIGTTSPGAPLEVQSRILVNNTSNRGDAYLELDRGTAGKDESMIAYGDDGNMRWYSGIPYNCGSNTDRYVISRKSFINDCNTNRAPEFTVRANGNVGIGLRNPSSALEVNGRINSNGISETSDKRMKKDISLLEDALSKVESLRGVTYNWRTEKYPGQKFDQDEQVGVIAQEVEQVLPEVVHTDDKGYKSVEYSHLVPVLIEAVKEQQQTIDSLRSKTREIDRIKAQNQQIMERLNELEKQQSYRVEK